MLVYGTAAKPDCIDEFIDGHAGLALKQLIITSFWLSPPKVTRALLSCFDQMMQFSTESTVSS